jgi:hypothetical protein
MPDTMKLPAYRWFQFLRNAPIRMGIYTGVALSLVFSAWVIVANRMPLLEPFARARNIGAIAALCFFASLPTLRFFRSPGDMLVSGLVGWTILSFSYRILCAVFVLLQDRYTAFHVFMLGAVIYLICATVSWIGTIIWRARMADGTRIHH